MAEIQCWKCANTVEVPAQLPFREVCDHCGSYLHTCKGCMNYKVGLRNDCKIPETDPIADREWMNYCEYFEQGRAPEQHLSEEQSRKKFDDLFG